MVRRRTAVSIAAAGLLLASPALTACGSGPAHAGAAAIVGHHRITESALQARVNAVRAAQAASPQGAGQQQGTNVSTQTLTNLVQSEVISRAVDDAGVTVSDGDVQANKEAALQQFGGSEKALDAYLLQNQNVPPSGVDAFFRTNVQIIKLTEKLGFQPGSDPGVNALIADLSKTAQQMGVTINPRYGAWDPAKATIGKAQQPWLADKTLTGATAVPGVA